MGLSSSSGSSSENSANSARTPLAERVVEMAARAVVERPGLIKPPTSKEEPKIIRARLPEFLFSDAEPANKSKAKEKTK